MQRSTFLPVEFKFIVSLILLKKNTNKVNESKYEFMKQHNYWKLLSTYLYCLSKTNSHLKDKIYWQQILTHLSSL